jgi:hypothetical protein
MKMQLRRKIRRGDVMKAAVLAVVLVCAVLAGWRVHKDRSVNTYDACVKGGGTAFETYPPSCIIHGKTFFQPAVRTTPVIDEPGPNSPVKLDKSLNLPAGWKVLFQENASIVIGGTADDPNECAFEASVKEDDAAKKSNAPAYTQQLFQADIGRLTYKGYVPTKLPGDTLKVDSITYTTQELRTNGPGRTDRNTTAYVVGEGKVGTIDYYCKDSTDERLAAEKKVINETILPAIHFYLQ